MPKVKKKKKDTYIIIIVLTQSIIHSCGVNNFASRQECFKCNEPRPEGMGPPKREPRPGDWDCPSYVYYFSFSLFVEKKNQDLTDALFTRVCRCNINNFGTRTECFKCGAARPEGMGVPPPEDRPERAYNWASNRARYEFNENAIGEDGMAPRDEKLEAELFGFDPTEQHTPLDFSKYANIPINIERGEAPAPVKDVSCCCRCHQYIYRLTSSFYSSILPIYILS